MYGQIGTNVTFYTLPHLILMDELRVELDFFEVRTTNEHETDVLVQATKMGTLNKIGDISGLNL